MPIRATLAGLLAALSTPVLAQVGFPEYPSISPDGSLVVFSWAGDLWAVPVEGGPASRLTSHPAEERRSAFTPDGATLIFESDRDGGRNLYAAPITRSGPAVVAGDLRRVTITDRSLSLAGTTPDGAFVLISGGVEPSLYRHGRMYKAPLDGGPIVRLTNAYGSWPRMTQDGASVYFTRGTCEWERPLYRGSGDQDVWRMSLADGAFTQVTTFDGNDGDAFPLPDGSVIFVSSRDGQNNLYRLASGAADPGTPAGDGITQLTSFKPADGQLTIGHGVRDLCVASDGSRAVFCVWDTLYSLDLSAPGAAPTPITIAASADVDRSSTTQVSVDRLATEAVLSPDGKTIALIARGEVFVRSVDDDRPTRRVTYTYGRERDLVWSPDGRSLYFTSDESGTLGIYEARVALALEDIYPKTEESKAADKNNGNGAQTPAAPAIDDPVSGTWECSATGGPPLPPEGITFALNLTLDGDAVSGTIAALPIYQGPVTGSYDKNARRLTLTIASPGGDATLTLDLGDGTLSGAASMAGASFQITGTRTSKPEAPALTAPAGRRDDFQPADPPAEPPAQPQPPAQPAASPQPEPPAATAAEPIAGTWSCRVTGPAPLPPDGILFTLTLAVDGDAVTGTISCPGWFAGPIENAAWSEESRKLTFTLVAHATPVSAEFIIANKTLAGTVSAAGRTFQVSGAPQQPPAPKPEAKPKEPPKVDQGLRWAESITYEVQPLIDTDAQERAPVPSPDGRYMLYARSFGDLVLVNMKDGTERVILSTWDAPPVQWAGDSRHIIYALEDLDFNSDIWLLDALDPDAKPINLTRHPDLDYSPRLSADGKVLVFLSDRAGDNFEFNVWAVYLDKSLETMTSYELAEHFKKAADEAKKYKPIDLVDFDAEYKAPEPFTFDADDAYLRVRRLTSFPGSQSDLAITPGGDRTIFSANVDGTSGLYSIDHKAGDRKSIATGAVADVRVTPKGDLVTFVAGGQAKSAAPTGGKSETWAIRATLTLDIAQQQRQKFLDAARILFMEFYNLKGLDWPGLAARYLPLAMQTRTSPSFNRVASMLMGELNGSHLGIGGGGSNFSAPSANMGYLGIDASPVPGGFRVDSILRGSPAEARNSRLEVGDILVAVNGQRLAADDASLPTVHLPAAFTGLAGEQTLLEIKRQGEANNRLLIITPISYNAWNELAYDAEVLARRERVEQLSDGKIGYLHIRGMSQPSVRDFERDLFAAAEGKIGLIIDVRDNGGGSTADILLASLTAPVHAYTVPRGARAEDAAPDSYPRDRRLIYPYQRPISVLINQNSFSNAEIFAHAIKTIGRGKLVGTATFGGVISTGGTTLIDGTTLRTPFRGWYLPDGTDMEMHGAQPDIDVPQLPADEAAGRDAQLEAAVTELLQRAQAAPRGLWLPGQ